jgi:ABC-type branched-subunit amino acid transport system substrate-binding protein
VPATSKRLSWLAAIAAVAMLAVACGGGSRASDPTGSGTGSGSNTTVSSQSSTSFGDLASPCGPADSKGAASTGAAQQGVTDTGITIGYGDDAGYQGQPGLNHEMSDAVKAMITWCNDQGGINGRTITGNYYDAKILDVNTAMQEACSQVFMLVGQGWALDGSSEQTRLNCRLPMVPGYTGSSAAAMAPLMVQPVPNPIDEITIQQAYALKDAFPDKVTQAAAVYPGQLPASVESVGKVKATYPQAGWTFLDCDQTYQLAGEADWKPFAQRLKDCGAEAVAFSGGEGNFENLLDASAQVGFEPIWFTEANFYTQTFALWNGSGNADQVYVKDIYVPLFDAPADSATAQYIKIVEGDGGDISQLGTQATSAFLLWATAAKECGADLTRDCVMQKLHAVTEWTGGGLHAPTNPGQNQVSECGNVLKMDGTTWTHWSPEGDMFACDPTYRAKVDPPLASTAQLQLDANRVARQYGSGS